MKSEPYLLTHDESCCYFEFLSEGSIKTDRKVVIYSQMKLEPEKYNLFLGHVLPTGNLCDLTVSNNGDMDKIISTVIQTMFIFLKAHPSKSIYFTGSNDTRVRLYRGVISRELSEAENYFEIYGMNALDREPFKANTNYDGFLIKLKQTL